MIRTNSQRLVLLLLLLLLLLLFSLYNPTIFLAMSCTEQITYNRRSVICEFFIFFESLIYSRASSNRGYYTNQKLSVLHTYNVFIILYQTILMQHTYISLRTQM